MRHIEPPPTRTIMEWFADRHPESVERAGEHWFVDIGASRALIDHVDGQGGVIRRMRGFAVASGVAHPVTGQDASPGAMDLLDCETPSGSSCGDARRLVGRWGAEGVGGRTGRHMLIVEIAEED